MWALRGGAGWPLFVLLVRAGRSYGKLERGPRLGARVPFLLFMFLFLHPAVACFDEFSFEVVGPESAVFRYVYAVVFVEMLAVASANG